MADKLATWKQALIHLEKETITTVTDDVEPRYVFDAAWPGVVAEAFNEGDWNFAKKSVALVLNVSETAALGYTYVFDYPADYMRTLVVSATTDFMRGGIPDYVDQGGFLHSNNNVLYLRYISDAKMVDASVTTWPDMFWLYVAVKLALATCGKLTSGDTLYERLEKKQKKALRQLKSVDARNEPNKTIPMGSWLRARRSGYGNSGELGNIVVGGEIQFEEGDV